MPFVEKPLAKPFPTLKGSDSIGVRTLEAYKLLVYHRAPNKLSTTMAFIDRKVVKMVESIVGSLLEACCKLANSKNPTVLKKKENTKN